MTTVTGTLTIDGAQVPFTGTIPTPPAGPPGPAGVQGAPGVAGTSPTAAAVAAALAATPSFVTAVAAAMGSPVAPPPTGTVINATGTNIYAHQQFGNYVFEADNWGNLPGEVADVVSEANWTITAPASNTDTGSIRAYPHVTRGWMEDQTAMAALSTPGTNDWTTKCGMGIQLSNLTKCKAYWSMSAPQNTQTAQTTNNAGAARWMGLKDIYFHAVATPAPTDWPPLIDLMIDQALADEIINSTTFYRYNLMKDHGFTVTIGGNTYNGYIDDPSEATYHATGGHTLHLFLTPTAFQEGNNLANWGQGTATDDIAAIIKYFSVANPVDSSGAPILDASDNLVSYPIFLPSMFLTAVNQGWEIDVGTLFTTTGLSVVMQNEAG